MNGFDLPFNTDFWTGSPPMQFTSGVTGQQPEEGNPVLPALWWLGILIALVVIRVLSGFEK